MNMFPCQSCEAFVPQRSNACPCCEAPVRRRNWWRRALNFLRAAGGGAAAVTLMACYGGPAMPVHPDDIAPLDSSVPVKPDSSSQSAGPVHGPAKPAEDETTGK